MSAIEAEQLVEELRQRHRPESDGRGAGRHGPHHAGRGRRCLVVYAQFEQAQLPPHAQPPDVDAVDALDASPVPTTAKVENITFVLVLSQLGQTWRSSRLA